MYCDTFASQVVDSENTAYDISSEVVKDEDLPNGFAVFVQHGGCMRGVRGVDSAIS